MQFTNADAELNYYESLPAVRDSDYAINFLFANIKIIHIPLFLPSSVPGSLVTKATASLTKQLCKKAKNLHFARDTDGSIIAYQYERPPKKVKSPTEIFYEFHNK